MKSVLVTYASEHGATAQIAQTIAKVLRQFNLEVTAKRVEAIQDISTYNAIVVGSAIYLGDWLPQARAFLENYQNELGSVPIWIFSSGPTGTEKPIECVPNSLEALVASLHPREIRVFHGKIDLRRLQPDERELIKAADMPRGDFRDWDAIRLWATNISKVLAQS